MLIPTQTMLNHARAEKYAVGAFNVYNMEGALAVVQAAEELNSPVLLQILPSALKISGMLLVRLCLEAGQAARVPVSVHLDHCADEQLIANALKAGISSVMADGSMHDYDTNMAFTNKMVRLASRHNAGVEAELGRITGTEDGLSSSEFNARMTRVSEAAAFYQNTDICALAVCIGNIHGKYHAPPELDFSRLEKISSLVSIPLVLHGTSGLPDEMILKAVTLGVCKFNVNTEVRSAYLNQMNQLFQKNNAPLPELVDIMHLGIGAMKISIKEKMHLFGSVNKANLANDAEHTTH